MRSYLSMIPIVAKVRKRQNRLTILCIMISVLLVTAIFSTADMVIRAESAAMQDKHGSWHIRIENISKDAADAVCKRPDVAAAGWFQSLNLDVDQPYYAGDKKAALYGTDDTYMTQLTNSIEEGSFPQNDKEILLSSNAKLALNVKLKDRVTIQTPGMTAEFTVSGFGSDDKEYYQGQTYLTAVYMTRAAFDVLMRENGISDSGPVYYVKFQNAAKAADAVPEFQKLYNLNADSISENTAVMGLSGKSSSQTISGFYTIAAVLFVLVLLAGVLMISGSMNSNVAQRTKFFGMLRCIGASRSQIMHFVRLEALNWCKTAVPFGLLLGTAVSWAVCASLRYGIGGEFAFTPVFRFSFIGLISGAAVGTVTVLLAAQSPARHAAEVSPAAAVSGSMQAVPYVRHASRIRPGRIERTLGIYHAAASKKNWFLMTASFSLSMILFLCFYVGLDFAKGLLPSMRSWRPDVILNGYSNALVLERGLAGEIRSFQGVEEVFACSYMENIPAASLRQETDHINLISYSDSLLDSAKDSVTQGDFAGVYGNSSQVMTVSSKDNPLKIGDTVRIGGHELQISCTVSDGVFPSEYSIICSEETFEQLTGETNYSMICVQLSEDAPEETIRQISSLAESDVIFTDMRESNKTDAATFFATKTVVYSFLAVIAMITIFNMVNSISMSVTARIKQYGAMRAVGMDGRQLTRMIASEAFTYAVSGLVTGCAAGVLLSRYLYRMLITRYFGTEWELPGVLIAIIVVFDFLSVAAAVYAPSKRIRGMAVTDTINEL